jgi:hypothetical protein
MHAIKSWQKPHMLLWDPVGSLLCFGNPVCLNLSPAAALSTAMASHEGIHAASTLRTECLVYQAGNRPNSAVFGSGGWEPAGLACGA